MLGNGQKSDNKAFFLKIRTQDKNKQPIIPEFEVQTKEDVDGEVKYVTSNTKKVAGDLVAVKVSKRTVTSPAGQIEVDDVKLIIEDAANKEVYHLDARPNNLTRGLYNSLLNLTSGENISISVYQTRPSPTDGKVYPAISLWQNDKQVKWKYQKADLPEVEEVKDKKGKLISRSFEDVNLFFFEKLKVLVPSFKGKTETKVKKAAPEVPLDVDDSVDESESDLDSQIPF